MAATATHHGGRVQGAGRHHRAVHCRPGHRLARGRHGAGEEARRGEPGGGSGSRSSTARGGRGRALEGVPLGCSGQAAECAQALAARANTTERARKARRSSRQVGVGRFPRTLEEVREIARSIGRRVRDWQMSLRARPAAPAELWSSEQASSALWPRACASADLPWLVGSVVETARSLPLCPSCYSSALSLLLPRPARQARAPASCDQHGVVIPTRGACQSGRLVVCGPGLARKASSHRASCRSIGAREVGRCARFARRRRPSRPPPGPHFHALLRLDGSCLCCTLLRTSLTRARAPLVPPRSARWLRQARHRPRALRGGAHASWPCLSCSSTQHRCNPLRDELERTVQPSNGRAQAELPPSPRRV